MSLEERLDLFALKAQFERFSELVGLGTMVADVGFCAGRGGRCCRCR